MSLSDSPHGQKYNVRRRSTNAATNKTWSDAQKIEAVTLWLSMGNLRLVGATLRIPEQTLRNWRATQWWRDIAQEIQLQDKIQLSATAKNIIDKSMAVIADRLEAGDWIYDQKSGQMRRKPVAMKDALAVADRLMDRKEKLDKLDVTEQSSESIEQKLDKLMQRFSQAAQPQVTDVVYVKEENGATNEEGAERNLRSGLLLRQGVSEETGTSEEQGGEEFGPQGDQS